MRSENHHSLYVLQTKDFLLVAITYVDDLIILSKTIMKLDWLEKKLERDFDMSNLEKYYYCFGVKFTKNKESKTNISSQSKYIKEILKELNIEDCKPIARPLLANLKLM